MAHVGCSGQVIHYLVSLMVTLSPSSGRSARTGLSARFPSWRASADNVPLRMEVEGVVALAKGDD